MTSQPSPDVAGIVSELTELASEDEMILCEPWPELRRVFRQAAQALTTLSAERDEWKAEYFRRHQDAADNAERALIAEADNKALREERDEALGDRDDLRERLHDLVMIDSEEDAIGGGPGFAERKKKAWARAYEPFEP